MQVTTHNDVKVYNLSAGKSLPQFLEDARKKQQSLRYDDDFRRRIDLIQDFEFPITSGKVRVSPDGEYICASGVYPPEIRMFETRELSMKFSRGLNCEVVDFLFLSEDWKKLAIMMEDRVVEFHSQYGRHHRVRVPKAGRSMCYDTESCVLYVSGSWNEVVRIDLEGGEFRSTIQMEALEEVNSAALNPVLPIVSFGGDKGLVESYDPRNTSKPLGSLRVCGPQGPGGADSGSQVTVCTYSSSGMLLAAGTDAGIVRVYDVRSSKPLVERDHNNGYAIRSVQFHAKGKEKQDLLIGSADSKAVKIWGATTGALHASVESPTTINDLTFVPNSGLFFTGCDQQRIGIYFVPSIGLAPQWCSFLDSITEELEESTKKQVFDDYQFVTNDQLEQLGATELVGTKFLQPYMHGFFMDHRLHAKLKAAMEPFAFEEYRKARISKRIEAKRTMRTRLSKSKVEVNPDLHKKLQHDAEEGDIVGQSRKRKQAADRAKKLLDDDRFQALFADADFAIEASAKAKEALAPSAADLAAAGPRKKGKPKS
mmetsp:Transcript_42871/g.127034  ORF Transcript_42871/g.127034 Transcript_42871/m.127034 type:complete len:539 (+) Transcript_42871:99-1715(+)